MHFCIWGHWLPSHSGMVEISPFSRMTIEPWFQIGSCEKIIQWQVFFSHHFQDFTAFTSLVGGLEHVFLFSIDWECHNPNLRTHMFRRGRYTTNQSSSSSSLVLLLICVDYYNHYTTIIIFITTIIIIISWIESLRGTFLISVLIFPITIVSCIIPARFRAFSFLGLPFRSCPGKVGFQVAVELMETAPRWSKWWLRTGCRNGITGMLVTVLDDVRIRNFFFYLEVSFFETGLN